MISPYNTVKPTYKPAQAYANNTQLSPEQKEAIVKTTELYGSSFILATLVATAFALTENLTFPKILLGAVIITAPIGLAIKEGAKLICPNKTTKQ